jgi:cellobiose phosphorylase
MLAASLASTAHLGASPIGHWSEDSQGLPTYDLTAKLPIETHDADGKPYPLREDPIFLLGNYRLSLFVHGSGILQIVTGERAWARLNAAGNSYGSNRSVLRTTNADGESRSYSLVGLDSLAADPAVCQRAFGTGFAQFNYTLGNGLEVSRTISVPPSEHINEGLPGFVVSVTLRNRGTKAVALTYEEAVLANYEAMKYRLQPPAKRLVQYAPAVSVSQKDFVARCDFTASSEDSTVLRRRADASEFDAFPPALTLVGLSTPHSGEKAEMFTEPGPQGGDFLGERFGANLAPGEMRTLHWIVSIVPQAEDAVVKELRAAVDVAQTAPFFRGRWKQRLPDLSHETDPVWRREMTWNAYVLEAMATYSEYYHETFIPQGETYDYEMGMTAAPRDQLQHLLPLCYTDPALAKSTLLFVLKKMTSQGELPYLEGGFGITSNSAWNTSDQQLFLFFAVGEYLRITKDYAFLGELSEYLPMEAHYRGSTLEKLDHAFAYLRDEVGYGPHGLVRLMNSDWSDMIYSDTPLYRYFFTAESHMNSAMVLSVMPNLIDQLNAALSHPELHIDRTEGQRLVQGMSRYLELMRKAFYGDMGDARFSKRLYFDANHSWGADTMHIEPQDYLMLAPDFPLERKQVLWGEVQARVLKDEQIGPRQREVPIAKAMYQAGTGENGGVWYALVGPMIAGVGTIDKPAAWSLLRRLSMDNFAKTFPNYWVGQWTAPECFNSVCSGPIAGLPRTGDNWTWTSFPAYCAHAHAWPLYCYYRLREGSN